jgi:hypothetical protein
MEGELLTALGVGAFLTTVGIILVVRYYFIKKK